MLIIDFNINIINEDNSSKISSNIYNDVLNIFEKKDEKLQPKRNEIFSG